MRLQRQHAVLLGVVLVTVLAGCSSLGGLVGGGPTCGPANTTVADISESNETIRVKGEAQNISERSVVIWDGSGTIEVVSLSGIPTDEVESGDCLIADGVAVPNNDSEEYNATMIAERILVEEVRVEGE